MAYIGARPVNGFFNKQDLTTDGSTTSFALDFTVGSTTSILVSVGGVIQEPDVAYLLSGGGTNIVFTTAPASTLDTYVHFLGQAIVQNVNDLNGIELVLDVDADTTITADTDDQIDFKLGGSDVIAFKTTGIHLPDNEKYVAGTGDDLQIYHDGSNSYIANAVGALKVATETSGIAVTIGHSTSEVTFGDNVTVTGNLTIGGTTNFGDFDISNVGSIALDTITNDGTDITLDSSGDIILDAAGNDIFFKAAGTTIGEIENESNNLIIKSSVSDADLILRGNDGGAEISALTFDMSAAGKATFNDQVVVGDGKLVLNSTAVTSTAAELNLLDGVSGLVQADLTKLAALDATATELNLLDGDTGASSVTLVDADRIIVNDNGTMKQVAVSALNTYTSASIAADDISAGDGAVNITTSSGNITIDAAANDSDIIFKGTDNSADITMLTLDGSADGAAIFKSSIAAVSLDISGDVDVDGTLETDALSIASTTVTSTAAELNLLDGKDATNLALIGKVGGTNFTSSLLIGHATTGTLNAAEFNTIIGDGAGNEITSGDNNTVIGYNSGTELKAGANNVGLGGWSLSQISTQASNTAIGYLSQKDATGSGNTSLGYDALEDVTGNYNIGIGYTAGKNITTGSGNVIIGDVDAAAADSARTLKIAGNDGSTLTTWISGDSSGNLTFAGDVTVGDDLNLTTDSTVINFGADSDTTLTHTDGSGLTLNSTNKLMFNDASQFIQGASATVLDIAATDEIELTATLIEVVGNATVSGTLGVTGVTTSNAGVVVDNITIDGTEIDLSSGDLTVDVAGDIILDAGGGNIKVSVATTQILDIANSSNDVIIKPTVDAKDIIFQQADGTSILEINDGAYARFTAAAIAPEATLTDASTVTINALTQSVSKVTLGGNRTIGLASGGVSGAFISILVIQDGTGSRTVTWNAAYEFAADTAPTLTTTANLGDLFVFRYNGAKWLEVGRNLALTLS